MNIQPLFLIVDDYDQMRSIIISNLKTLGYSNMITAQNGEDAIKKLSSNPVNIILSDWNMPQMTGLELLTWVRKDKKYQFTPFIMITAEVGRQQVEKAIASGGTGLGTYSARLIAEAQNGSISMQTSEESGTTIEVTLPKGADFCE
jgi:two-component system chemotaxis response regulator CheY